MPMLPILRHSLFAICAALPAAGWADLPIREDDRDRIAQFDASFGHAMHQALSGGEPADIADLTGAMRGLPLPSPQGLQALSGDWSCQMMKLGGNLPLVVYQTFSCRISGTRFTKLTGSQRSTGTLHQDGDRLIYLGTAYIAGDTAPDYADLPDLVDPHATPQRVPDVGLVEVMSPSRARIMFPDPHLESDLNVLYLTR